jgi:hypothetical protein
VELAGTITLGVGFTVMVYVRGVPVHPPGIVGVTVIVDVMAAVVAFVAVNAGVFPLPLAAKPMAVLELVQVYVAPAGVLE